LRNAVWASTWVRTAGATLCGKGYMRLPRYNNDGLEKATAPHGHGRAALCCTAAFRGTKLEE
jgi:hypothetical protein